MTDKELEIAEKEIYNQTIEQLAVEIPLMSIIVVNIYGNVSSPISLGLIADNLRKEILALRKP